MKDFKLCVATCVLLVCMFVLIKDVQADDGVMEAGFTCYTNAQLQESFEEAYQYGQQEEAQNFFDNITMICESGQEINLPGLGILSCEGVK